MKRYLNLAFFYAVWALLSGVFYREFTKIKDFSGQTQLSGVHGHLFVLGMVMFLIIALFAHFFNLNRLKSFKLFMIFYNLGVCLSAVMFMVKGSLQVLAFEFSRTLTAAFSGISGIAHIFITIGLIALFISLKKLDVQKHK